MRMRSWLARASAAAGLVLASLLLAGPACAAEKDEVQQKLNPVNDLHQEILKQKELEKNTPRRIVAMSFCEPRSW